ncbi:MAG TPA: choice-of-anchor Q domain-containing protein [Chthoniobacterales bacterium]|nr:choice-of-anchor Q domain-containing protein [Chthoniobacterales bacterium]
MRPFLASLTLSPVAIVTLFFAAAASVQGVHAATLVVTTTADSGAGSLRDTIAAASDGDTIQFDAALNGQTITLTSAELLINKNLIIDGPGAHQLTVQRSTATGTPAFRIFNASGSFGVTIAGLTIANGSAPDAGGGGIASTVLTLTVANCVISGNNAQGGGGILCAAPSLNQSTVSIANCTISGNSAASGGGIHNDGPIGMFYRGSVLTITNSTISGNAATFMGDGLSQGGGIANLGRLTVINSTISDNVVAVDESRGGGGIYTTGTLAMTNTTISGNSANLGGGIRNLGTHAIHNPGALAITNSTVSGNSASEGGGLLGGGQSRNAIIALNTSANGPDVNGTLRSEGFNLIGNNSGAIIFAQQPSDQIGTPASPIDPLLGPLQNNGGPTFTHALLQGSPALDQGESSGSTTDQRGFHRPVDFPDIANEAGGDGADIGAFESAPATLANISTRLRVETGDNAMIGGFIITGTEPKTVIVRGIGPSLSLPGALADPIIEVHGPSGELLATNDNWRDGLYAQQVAQTLPPASDLESALHGTINPGAYTVVVRGTNNTTGIALFEVYDLDPTAASKLGNISTRGFVSTGDNVMIGGVILVGSAPARVLFRAIGPSLTNFGVPNALADPILELYDANGGLIAVNYNWRDDQEAEILATGIPPSNDLEAAIVRDFAPGNYTAIVRGLNNATGMALVEAYDLN